MNYLLNRAVENIDLERENIDLERENNVIAYGCGIVFAVLCVAFFI